MFGLLFGKAPVAEVAPGRGWTTEVVGESQYQDELRVLYRMHGGTEHDIKVIASVVPEDDNRHDPNAVRVEIKKRVVGYLTRQMAAEYRAAVGTASGRCSAKIVGGFALDNGILRTMA